MSIQVRVNGWFLSTIAAWGELQWAHSADGGCKSASWRMDLPPTFTHSALVRGAIVEIRCGAMNVWQGVLTEPDMDDDWTFNALGLSALGSDFLCFDSSGNTTSTPDTAIDQAISRGLAWTRQASVSTSPVGSTTDATDDLNRVGALLDAYVQQQTGQRWGVDADGNLFVRSDPVTPAWFASPGSGRLGLADDDFASDIFVRYLNTSAAYATTTAGDSSARTNFGRREYPADATNLGPISSTKAAAVGTSLLTRGKARLGYTNGIEVNNLQLTTPGGTPAFLPYVTAGDKVRMFGVVDEQGSWLPYVDWIIGETSYTAGSDTIILTPAGLVDRNLTDAFTVAPAQFAA